MSRANAGARWLDDRRWRRSSFRFPQTGIKRSENLYAWVRAGDDVTQGRAVKLRLLLCVLVNFRCWKIASLGNVVASLLARRSPRHLATEEQ
jgi:hypothetical protein